MYYVVIMLLIVALDRFVKYMITMTMTVGQSIPVIENIFHISYIQNRGAAFSSFSGQRVLLIAVTLVLIIAGLVFIWKHKDNRSKTLITSLSFIVAGGIGNLIDRVAYGYVVDMFDFRVFPVFNVADIFVCVGCALLCIYVIFLDGKTGKKR